MLRVRLLRIRLWWWIAFAFTLHALVARAAAPTAACAALAAANGAFSAAANAARNAPYHTEGDNATYNEGNYHWPSKQREHVGGI